MYLNQFDKVFKVFLLIHCDPVPVISPNTVVHHTILITVHKKRSGKR